MEKVVLEPWLEGGSSGHQVGECLRQSGGPGNGLGRGYAWHVPGATRGD